MKSTKKQEAMQEKEEVMEIKELEAKGGARLKVKIRKADYDRLTHMKEFFKHEHGINPSNAVLIRWMIDFFMESIDEYLGQIEPSYRYEEIKHVNLNKVVEDDPLVLPDIYYYDDGSLITYTEKRYFEEEECICNECRKKMCIECMEQNGETGNPNAQSDASQDDCPSTKGKD